MTDPTVSRLNGRQAAARRTRRRRLFAGGAGVLVLCLAGGGVALAAGREAGPAYRTATAAVGSVEQTLAAVGTLSSATRLDTAFSVAGTVATVPVTVGATVDAGAVLATLDTASLETAIEDAASTLADAEQQLTDDLASQTASATASAATGTAATASAATAAARATAAATPSAAATTSPTGLAAGSPATEPTAAVAAAVSAVQRAQQDLMTQYEVTAAALAKSTASVATSQSVCETFLAASDDLAVVPDDTTPTDTPTDTPTAVPPTTTEALTACQEAIGQVLTDQVSVDTAQASLLAQATALDKAVAGVPSAVAAAVSTPTPGSTTGASTGAAAGSAPAASTASTSTASAAPTSASPTGAGGQTTSTVASAATILADKAAIAAAEGEVAIAKDAATRVDLTSPIAGTVAAVSVSVGDAVTASSTTSVITVIGADGFVATATVPLSAIDTVDVGQSASLTAASTTAGLTGKVSSIGVLNTSTSSSDPAYTVVIAIDPTSEPLFNGASAQVVVTVASKEGVLSVPTSAVHVDGSSTTVQVLDGDGFAAEVTVEIGAIGSELTEILSGLTEGDEVVLADLSEVLVSDTSTDSSRTSLGGSTKQVGQTGRPDFGEMPAGRPGGFRPGG
ncbi:MAG: biotin/lipoyl-binding protein [Cellulomonas sp.]